MPEIDIRVHNGKKELHIFGVPGKNEPVVIGLRTLRAQKLLDEAAANFQTTRRKLIGKMRKEGPIEI